MKPVKSDDKCKFCSNTRHGCTCPRFTSYKAKAGQWIQPVRQGYQMECCDCGLVHVLNFRIRNGRPQFQAFRKEKNAS